MIFRLIQTNFDILGISRNQSVHALYVKVFLGLLQLGSDTVFHLKFVFRGNLAFAEYTESLYMTTIAVMSLLCYAVMVLTKTNFFDYIDNLESLIQQFSESESEFYFVFKLKLMYVDRSTKEL